MKVRIWFSFVLLYLAGCSSPETKVVQLEEAPPPRQEEREKTNEKQKTELMQLAEVSDQIKRDLEYLLPIAKAEVNITLAKYNKNQNSPRMVHIRLFWAGKQKELTTEDKKKLLAILIFKYKFPRKDIRVISFSQK